MNHKRGWFACSTMVSPAHDGRMVAVVAGGLDGIDGLDTAEILDFTMPGSVWELSEYYLSFFPIIICFNLIMEIGIYIYHMRAIITCSWFEIALNHKLWVLRLRKVSCNKNRSTV